MLDSNATIVNDSNSSIYVHNVYKIAPWWPATERKESCWVAVSWRPLVAASRTHSQLIPSSSPSPLLPLPYLRLTKIQLYFVEIK